MRPLKKVSILMKNTAQIGLVIFALISNCVLGDVVVSNTALGVGVPPVPVVVANPASFANLSVANSANFAPGGGPGFLPRDVLPFNGGAVAVAGCPFAAAFAGRVANQMPGFAVFFPIGGGGGNLYLGAMQPIAAPLAMPAINADLGEPPANHLTTMNDNSHTERQLVVAALNGGNDDLAGGAWAGAAANAALSADAGGTVCVFVRQSPCNGNAAQNNGGVSCVEYYRTMAIGRPALIFNVYFPASTTSINQHIVNNNAAFLRLITHLVGMLPAAAMPAVAGPGGIRPGNLGMYRVSIANINHVLEFLNPANSRWIPIATRQAVGGIWATAAPAPAVAVTNHFVNRINAYLNANPAQRAAFFNAVYGINTQHALEVIPGAGQITYFPI